MCGRFASVQPPDAMRALFRTTNPLPDMAQPSWNIAPSQPALAVRRHPETGARHLDLLLWGLVPHWTKDLKAARRPINARAERSCPVLWCRSGSPEQGWLLCQAAMGGRLTGSVLLTVAMVSSVM